ncbi:DNA-binding transcriptional activator GcvA [Sulfitobacter sp. THAF37]|uniref:helix-turn-helix domain-containing protein n=1 Tax=Sulfitobacter sp. THAF37 TaxID=2587855 RepID=UPI0012A7EE3C|nr:LysR family transcriptional regulator [Sulfitobacter sp. THAF37]QFT57813.1 DNA-binding transcriptional activator GcvA [Sulfitobacter sp. THAF37]
MSTIEQSESEVEAPPPALLFEMVRSFETLARTLNLSHAVKELGSTRQTLRRHIATLEAELGGPLFTVDERRYKLTEKGAASLAGAKDILARGKTWLRGASLAHGNLQFLKAHVGEWDFYQEQKPIGLIWEETSLLLRESFRAWALSSGQIESPNLAHVRPYLLVYRESGAEWICVEFGERSAYVEWFGLDYARSSIGRPIATLPAGEEFGHMLNQAFFDVQATQLARLDHVFTRMPLPDGSGWQPMAYQRLMMAGFFPDGSPAVLTLVVPSRTVSIRDLEPEKLAGLAELKAPDFGKNEARFEEETMT